MPWFKRTDKGILTPTEAKREVPDGLWFKSPAGKIVHTRELKNNAYVVPEEDFHVRIGSAEYFEILFDLNEFTEMDADMESGDPLKFADTKPYPKRIKESQAKSDLKDAVRTAYGKMNSLDLVIACMDFAFVGGSMGSVVGEKISRAIDHALKTSTPFLLDEAKIPYISLLTDPTTGGVTASFAMLGDFNIAEPNALIGFAGPRVIRETIGKDLPKGFQSAEFVLEHGFLDFIIDRRNLKSRLTTLLKMLKP